ncbi:MAG: SN-glycerol-3-phosphate ABC transporter, permease protein [Osedax symbiont Rs1]|nr:MAG: SN-glycerol-3-phosphate ABC transporter, permease protein [Osedax symbiont Rs1]
MIENRPMTTFISHCVLIIGVALIVFPIWVMIVAASHDAIRLTQVPLPLLPGDQFWINLKELFSGKSFGAPIHLSLFNSLIMALLISFGKITISIISAFAIVYFNFRFRMFFFWMIFITLMLPVEVRILPTYEVVANFNMLDSYLGLSLPLIASATATFMFRQTFLTIPDELMEASRIDGASPMRFFFDVVIPMSRTNIAALFVILFIYGWNQYLWPLLVTTDPDMYTVVMSIKQMLESGESEPVWHLIMLTALVAMLPPILVVIFMQKIFVKGLTDSEK